MFLEHTWAPSLGGDDPDRWFAGATVDVIPSYVAVRSRRGLLVRLDLDPSWERPDVAWEYYDYRDAPFERTNSFADPAKRTEVRRHLERLRRFLACRVTTHDEPVSRRCRNVTVGSRE